MAGGPVSENLVFNTEEKSMIFSFPDPWPAAADAARAHAVTAYPEESVGVILSDGEYLPLTNTAEDPKTAFNVSEDELAPYRLSGSDKDQPSIVCLIHSEPYEPDEIDHRDGPLMRGPSKTDMLAQQAWEIPFGLTVAVNGEAHGPVFWGDQFRKMYPAPLLGRPFIFGIYDCLSLLRDWFFEEKGIDLEDFPREMADIENDVDMYMPNVKAWGFELIDTDNLEPGDVLLWRAKSPVVNHAGIYLGDGLMIHHLRGGLSARQPVSVWLPHMTLAASARYAK